MTFFTDLFIKLFSLVLETVRKKKKKTVCSGYFDEPEVPEELTNLKR